MQRTEFGVECKDALLLLVCYCKYRPSFAICQAIIGEFYLAPD